MLAPIIRSNLGVVTTSSSLDVNAVERYVLEVLVQLPPPNIHTVTATITVTVVDVNDHAPSFADLPDRLSIAENTTVGTLVFTVKSTDKVSDC